MTRTGARQRRGKAAGSMSTAVAATGIERVATIVVLEIARGSCTGTPFAFRLSHQSVWGVTVSCNASTVPSEMHRCHP